MKGIARLFRLAVVVVLVRVAMSAGAAGRSAREGTGAGLGDELRYRVPNGQDPAPLMAALQLAGYDAAPETVEGHRHLVIACPNGRESDRTAIRHIIEENNRTSMLDGISLDGEVRFEGERSGR